MSVVRSVLFPSSGHGRYWRRSAKTIRFVRQGCTNRPFFHIVVAERRKGQHEPVIEQVGTYDEMPNKFNQKMVSLNYERIRHWLGAGAHLSRPVAELLGISGLLPVYPRTYMTAWKNRRAQREKAAQQESNDTPAVENS